MRFRTILPKGYVSTGGLTMRGVAVRLPHGENGGWRARSGSRKDQAISFSPPPEVQSLTRRLRLARRRSTVLSLLFRSVISNGLSRKASTPAAWEIVTCSKVIEVS